MANDPTLDQFNQAADSLKGKGGWFGRALDQAVDKVQTQFTLDQAAKDQAARLESEKSRVREKQIRALRNQYRPAGGSLLSATPRGVDLGTAPGLPDKLGSA